MANRTILNPFTGDLLLVPGGSSASGDVVGPASSTDNAAVRFDSTSGKVIQNSTVIIDDSGNTTANNLILSATTATTVPYLNASKQITSSAVTPTELGYVSGVTSAIQTQLGTKIGGSTGATDNALLRADGTGGFTAQSSTATIDDSGNINTNGNVVSQNASYLMGNIIGSGSEQIIFASGLGMPALRISEGLANSGFTTVFQIGAGHPSVSILRIKAHASQTANLSEIVDSSDVVLSYTAANGGIQADSGLGVKRRTTATSDSVLPTDYIIGVTDNSSARTITLPAASSCRDGQMFIIKDEAGTAASANNITISRDGSDTIDGTTDIVITANYGVCRLYSNGVDAFYTM